MTKISLDYEQVFQVQKELFDVAYTLEPVANNAYITQDMFPESESAAADAFNETVLVLAECATAMYDACFGAANFFQNVIEQFAELDENQAREIYREWFENQFGTAKEPPNQPK